jgi:hypothetical protein
MGHEFSRWDSSFVRPYHTTFFKVGFGEELVLLIIILILSRKAITGLPGTDAVQAMVIILSQGT